MSERLELQPGQTNEPGQVGDVDIVLITFGTIDELDHYLEHRDLDVIVLRDDDRSSYRSYGLGRASRRTVWGLATMRKYFDILRNSSGDDRAEAWRNFRQSNGDTLQLGGDFVIGPNGDLAWGFWSEGPADRPSADAVADAVAAARKSAR